jgi:hypothetical protein
MRVQPKSQKSPGGRRAWSCQYRTPQGRQTRGKLGDFPGISAEGARSIALERVTEAGRGVDLMKRKRDERAEGVGARQQTLSRSSSTATSPGPKTHLKSAAILARMRSDFEAWPDRPVSAPSPFTTTEPWRGSSRLILSHTCRVGSVTDLLNRRRTCVNTKSMRTALRAGLESKLSVIDRTTGLQICRRKRCNRKIPL